MIVALIHWRVRLDEQSIAAFLDHWRTNNTIGDRSGLMAEFLSDSLPMTDFPYITWHLDEESLVNFKSYVTIGLWQDAAAFREQVANYFYDRKRAWVRRARLFEPAIGSSRRSQNSTHAFSVSSYGRDRTLPR